MGSKDLSIAASATPIGGQFRLAAKIDDALPLLRRPFSPSAVRTKVQHRTAQSPRAGARWSATSTRAWSLSG